MKKISTLIGTNLLFAVTMMGLACLCGCASLDEPAPDLSEGDLQSAVVQRLAMDPMTREGLYGVEVVDAQVTIRGTVHSETERMRVLSLVRGTPGVESVSDRLRIVP